MHESSLRRRRHSQQQSSVRAGIRLRCSGHSVEVRECWQVGFAELLTQTDSALEVERVREIMLVVKYITADASRYLQLSLASLGPRQLREHHRTRQHVE